MLIRINELVIAINDDLVSHMMKEERILFPYVKELTAAEKDPQSLKSVGFGTVRNPIHMMEMEHETVGALLEKTRELSHNYRLPEDACASYSLLYRMLDEFEDDLHIHIHLENNILFPKAIALEQKLRPE